MTIRILIVDDHPVVRDGVRAMLSLRPDFEVVGEASEGSEAIKLCHRLRPDVVLMDLRMEGMDGVATTREITESIPTSRVLVLTTYDADSDILPAIEAGATGYMLKDAPREDLHRAVEATARGEAALSPSVAAKLMGRVGSSGGARLTPREIEVLQLAASGNGNAGIAEELHLSQATVKYHLTQIYGKLGVPDRASAVAVAVDRGFIRLGG